MNCYINLSLIKLRIKMLTGSYDIDGVVISFLDISTIMYNIKLINKYCHDIALSYQGSLHTNLFPITKSLLETEGFLDDQYDNMIYNVPDCSISDTKKCSGWMVLKLCTLYRLDINIIKRIIIDKKIIGDICNEDAIFDQLCDYCDPADLQWMKEKGFVGYINSYLYAIKYHKNSNLKWLIDNNIKCDVNKSLKYAIEYNNMEALRILVDICNIPHSPTKNDVENKNIFLNDINDTNNTSFRKKIVGYAIIHNNIDALDLLVNNNFPVDMVIAYISIAKTGNREMMHILQTVYGLEKSYCYFSTPAVYGIQQSDVFSYAAERGDKKMIEMFMEIGFFDKSDACTYGAIYCAKNKNTSFLLWLVNKGFWRYSRAFWKVLKNNTNCIYIMKWLMKNNFGGHEAEAVVASFKYSDLHTINWIYHNICFCNNEHYAPLIIMSDTLAERLDLGILIWIENNNINYDRHELLDKIVSNYMNKYSEKNVIEIIEWLVDREKNNCGENVFYYAMYTGNIRLIDILIQHKVPYNREIIHIMENTGRSKYTTYLLDKGY